MPRYRVRGRRTGPTVLQSAAPCEPIRGRSLGHERGGMSTPQPNVPSRSLPASAWCKKPSRCPTASRSRGRWPPSSWASRPCVEPAPPNSCVGGLRHLLGRRHARRVVGPAAGPGNPDRGRVGHRQRPGLHVAVLACALPRPAPGHRRTDGGLPAPVHGAGLRPVPGLPRMADQEPERLSRGRQARCTGSNWSPPAKALNTSAVVAGHAGRLGRPGADDRDRPLAGAQGLVGAPGR